MTPNREDYLKLIFELGGDTQRVSNKELTNALSVSPASVSEMISKLVKDGLVKHIRYQGVILTSLGLAKANTLLRKHRLWEVFLVENLGYKWNDTEVHKEAELLEHATSDELAARLDEFLNSPTYCPHGGIIPKRDEFMQETYLDTLRKARVGTTVMIARILDEKQFLDYLIKHQIELNESYMIEQIDDENEKITLTNEKHTTTISFQAASMIFIQKI